MGMPAAQSATARPQRQGQGQPNFQQFLQRLMAARQQGLFGQQGQGAQRFNPNINGLYGRMMPQIQYPQPVQQMARPMFQPPAPPPMQGQPGMMNGAAPPGIPPGTSGYPGLPGILGGGHTQGYLDPVFHGSPGGS